MTGVERRAERLLRCYPRTWRERYGAELKALLEDDLVDRPRSWRRDLDVVRAGFGARLAACGLVHGPGWDSSSATTLAAVASFCFAACGLSVWTQLADGRLLATAGTAGTPGTGAGLVVLTAWLVGLLAWSVFVGTRMALGVARALHAGTKRRLALPLLTFSVGAGVLLIGVRLMAASAPAVRRGRHGLLAHAAALGWAATQPISTFWVHPHRLLALPSAAIAWMLVCPLAMALAGWSLLRIRRVTRAYAPRWGGRTSSLAGLFFPLGLGAAAVWVIGSQHAADADVRAGTLDLLLIAVMACAWAVRRRAAHALAMLQTHK